MVRINANAFAFLLRQHRLRRRLTQEALAERAGISARSVGEMERGGGRGPRPGTVDQLAAALELTVTDHDAFVAAGQALFWESRAGRRERAAPADEVEGAGATDPNVRPGATAPGVPRQLPIDLPDFVGRDAELARLCAAVTSGVPVVAISGPPGVGKTALAVHAAHRHAPAFPDGQLYAGLRGAGGEPADPADVLANLLRVLGVEGSTVPAGVDARAALLRARLAGRRVLLVLDDAGGHHQIEPLLAGGSTSMLVTSRLPLTGLPGVAAVDLRPLPGSAAVELLGRVIGAERVRSEPSAATEVVAACGGLPLAVRIAAARLAARPGLTVGALAQRLADERHRLDELRHGDLAIRPGLHLSYQGLSSAAGRAFALLGGLGFATFPEWPVAALLGVDPAAGATVLDELLNARLLDELGADQAGQPRYRFHEITALYARERRDAEVSRPEWTAALARLAGAWLGLAREARDRLCCRRLHLDDPSIGARTVCTEATRVTVEHPIHWFEAERETLAVLVLACAESGLSAAARELAACGADFYQLRGYYEDWRTVTQSALEVCRRVGDRRGEAAMLRGLGSCLVDLDDAAAALVTLRAARELADEVGDRAGAAMARRDIGFVLGLTGRLDQAERELRAATDELARVRRPATRALALTNLGFVLRQLGRTAEAVRTIQLAQAIAHSCGDPFVQAYASRGLAGALLAAGRAVPAEQQARRAAALFQQLGDPIGTAQSLRALGEALAQSPVRQAEAERVLGTAAALFRDRGHEWGVALTELSLGEVELRRGAESAVDRLHRTLRYWTAEQIPALRARTLAALARAAEQDRRLATAAGGGPGGADGPASSTVCGSRPRGSGRSGGTGEPPAFPTNFPER
ncbi:tetratricopeptide repeat protein [Micromonospora sagamiensis]|uniref:NB-ARC domain-containing protein n=1 Tax=Micromonospora sagamiensis TaxID=47875 RepID=A0A562WJU7_9ACTN|nr:tetratricopeptide repeat protein [Micromonospora sagamiensis]TWJ30428.1 NB-ARC domain-containing protein [Micromonospora sagamiensis]BCL16542.1 hypothetical protein GCM10017556_42810 [Micromonospora sagamiensis]